MTAGVSRYAGGERMARHRHAEAYAAVVLSGGYLEAGDRGRFRAEPGHVLIHGRYESHQDAFTPRGATVLNILLERPLDLPMGVVADPDALARMSQQDPREAAEALAEMIRPAEARLQDWPDQIALAMAADDEVPLALLAEGVGIAPQSLSRGFRQAYGVSPKRYRAEQRALRAVRALGSWRGGLASLAAEFGFADQAHLTRAVVALTGCSPHRLRVQSVQEAIAPIG